MLALEVGGRPVEGVPRSFSEAQSSGSIERISQMHSSSVQYGQLVASLAPWLWLVWLVVWFDRLTAEGANI